MRNITLIIIHCSATPAGRDVRATDIDRWHRQQGWRCIGYHYVIDIDGTIERGRPEAQVGAHCKNHNAHSIGVCYIGGLTPKAGMTEARNLGISEEGLQNAEVSNCRSSNFVPADTRTDAQKKALLRLLTDLRQRYPKAIIVGHRDLDPHKSCPSFDATHEYKVL